MQVNNSCKEVNRSKTLYKQQVFGFLPSKREASIFNYLKSNHPDYSMALEYKLMESMKNKKLAGPQSDEIMFTALADGYKFQAAEHANLQAKCSLYLKSLKMSLASLVPRAKIFMLS